MAELKTAFGCSRLLGFFPFRSFHSNGILAFEESKNSIVYTEIVAVVFTLCQVYMVYAEADGMLKTPNGSKPTEMLLLFYNITLICSCFTLFIPVIRQRGVFCCWLNRLGDVFSNLTEADFKKVAAFYYCGLGATVCFAASTYAVDFYLYERFRTGHNSQMYMPDASELFNYVLIMQNKMSVQLFLVFVNLLRYYYTEVNDSLKCGKRCGDRKFWLEYIRELRLKDLEMKDLVQFLHSYFVPVVSLLLFRKFFSIIFSMLYIVNAKLPVWVQLLWGSYVLWDVFLLVALCQAVENEAEKTIHYLHQLFISWDDKELKKEIDLISLQLLHKRVEFNALGCHKINFSLLYWMVGIISSYTVIVAQFHVEPKAPLLGGPNLLDQGLQDTHRP